MASDGAKWSSYVHSHISDTQSVNTAPFCAGTQALVPEHQVLPSVDSPSPFKIIFSAFESKLNLSYDLFLQERSRLLALGIGVRICFRNQAPVVQKENIALYRG